MVKGAFMVSAHFTESNMTAMRFFVDTHDVNRGTFPGQISADALQNFYAQYEAACRAEGAVSLRLHVGLPEGRAFCFTMAPDAEAVRRAHERVGLAFDSITEVRTLTPADLGLAA